MSDINYNLLFKIGGDNQVMAAINKLIGGVSKTNEGVDNLNKKFTSLPSIINRSLGAIKLNAILDQVNRVSTGLSAVAQPGAELSNKMYDLQAITGVAGKKLQEIEGYARQSAKTFGGSAADSVESYKLILSQLSPEIAKVPVALKAMGNNVSITSKLMSGDALGATNLLTTAVNQYGVDLSNPIKASETMAAMMNVMAAGAKEGSAELPQIQQALENAGMAAKGANVSFEETNAAIQVLDKAGKKGAEGGVAIRNMLAIMGQGRFLPADTQKALKAAGVDLAKMGDNSLSLTDRLRTLTPVMNDGALLTKLFGMENQNAARALIGGVPEIARLTQAITGTNEAYKQAAIVMDSPLEKNKRLQAQVDDFKISIFNATGGWLGYMGVVSDVTRQVTDIIPLFSAASNITKVWTGVQALFNSTMWANPVTWIVTGIVALIGVIGYVIYKTEGWGKMWQHTVTGAGLLWEWFTSSAANKWERFINNVTIGLDYIKKGWYEFQNAVGMGDDAGNNQTLLAINNDIEARKKAITDGNKKVAELSMRAGKEFTAAVNSLSWNSDKKVTDLFGSKGIAAPSLPGGTGKAVDTGDGTGSGVAGAGSKGKNINDAIATGGAKNTTVNISIGKLVEKMLFEGGFNESADNMRDRIVDEITRAVAMGASLGGGN